MSQGITYSNCVCFDSNSCPYRTEKLMKDFIYDLEISRGVYTRPLEFSRAEEVNNKICNNCEAFRMKSK